MKTVYYKGKPYQYKVLGTAEGERQFSLYNDQGLLTHFVSENQLDKKKFSTRFLSNIVQAYYRTIMEEQPPLLG